MSRYELAKEAPAVMSNIELLFRGGRVPVAQGELESSVFDVAPRHKRYLGLTVYRFDGQPIGICDVMSVADTRFTVLEAPISRRRADLSVPAHELRYLADSDGLYVVEGHRGDRIGRLMLTTALELSKRFGSKWFNVRSPGEYTPWYKALGAIEIINGVQFDLSKATWR